MKSRSSGFWYQHVVLECVYEVMNGKVWVIIPGESIKYQCQSRSSFDGLTTLRWVMEKIPKNWLMSLEPLSDLGLRPQAKGCGFAPNVLL